MFTLPNLLSLLRLPLAFVFLQHDFIYRALAIILALITDGLDGFLARRYKMTNRLGALLDPLTDKFFVFFVLSVYIHESRLSWVEAACLISRDFSLFLYGLYMIGQGKLQLSRFRAIWAGKISTVLQLTIILFLTFGQTIWPFIYGIALLLGLAAFAELYHTEREPHQAEKV
jgi:CDP-diacylglycerol---glycerol-3-phosphate 3-phosphatidyltransferase